MIMIYFDNERKSCEINENNDVLKVHCRVMIIDGVFAADYHRSGCG